MLKSTPVGRGSWLGAERPETLTPTLPPRGPDPGTFPDTRLTRGSSTGKERSLRDHAVNRLPARGSSSLQARDVAQDPGRLGHEEPSTHDTRGSGGHALSVP